MLHFSWVGWIIWNLLGVAADFRCANVISYTCSASDTDLGISSEERANFQWAVYYCVIRFRFVGYGILDFFSKVQADFRCASQVLLTQFSPSEIDAFAPEKWRHAARRKLCRNSGQYRMLVTAESRFFKN